MAEPIILRAVALHVSAASAPRVVGHDRHGEPVAWADPVWRGEGEIFTASPEAARRLVASRSARRLDLDTSTSRLARLALAACPAPDTAEAAARGFGVGRTWHAVPFHASWGPAPARGLGIVRSPWEACFTSADQAREHFAANPEAVPLFLIQEGEHRLAYIWQKGGLVAVPTETQMRRR